MDLLILIMDVLKELTQHTDHAQMFKLLKDNKLLIPETDIPFAPHIYSLQQCHNEAYEILEHPILPGAMRIILNRYKSKAMNPPKVIAYFGRLFFRGDADIASYVICTLWQRRVPPQKVQLKLTLNERYFAGPRKCERHSIISMRGIISYVACH